MEFSDLRDNAKKEIKHDLRMQEAVNKDFKKKKNEVDQAGKIIIYFKKDSHNQAPIVLWFRANAHIIKWSIDEYKRDDKEDAKQEKIDTSAQFDRDLNG